MTLWWVEREREGEVQNMVPASSRAREACLCYMLAVGDCQSGDKFRLCRSEAGGERQVVDEHTLPPKASKADGEWRTGPWRTNDGRECVILEVHDDGRLSWAFPTALAWVAHCDHPGADGHHPAQPVREVVQRHKVHADGVFCSIDDDGTTQVRWTIRGGKIVGVELVEGEQ